MLSGKFTDAATDWPNTQNRVANMDRLAAGLNYEINPRAELKFIRLRHKMDELTVRFE